MTKAVFTTKLSPSYDDIPEQRYHFPRTYLRAVEQSVGDFIVYYEPRRGTAESSSRGGRQAYFAVARVAAITSDARDADLFYAQIDGYLSFDTPVGFRGEGATFERMLTRADGGVSKGAFGRSVRLLAEDEFQAILAAGFKEDPWDDLTSPDTAKPPQFGVQEEIAIFERPLVEQTILRPFREAAFKRAVRRAYGNRCALTGLRLINGGGRPEVQAAHIMPVASNGPDSVRNGLALSGTMHWLFDRGLITVDPGMGIHDATELIPPAIHQLLNQNRRLLLPDDVSQHPHPKFLEYHREVVAAGKAWPRP